MGILEKGLFGRGDQTFAKEPDEDPFLDEGRFIDEAVLVATMTGTKRRAKVLTVLMGPAVLFFLDFDARSSCLVISHQFIGTRGDRTEEDDQVDDMGEPFHRMNEVKAPGQFFSKKPVI